MQFPTATKSTSRLVPVPRGRRLLRVAIVGPELLAHALHALLATFTGIQALSPISEPDQVVPFIGRIGSTGHPIDAVLFTLSSDLESDLTLLQHLVAARQRCLVVASFYLPSQTELLMNAGAHGLFLAAMPAQQLTTALRTVADGRFYFPDGLFLPPARETAYLVRPRLITFHEDRLRALAHECQWQLTDTDINILRHFSNASVEELANRVQLQPATVRRELSGRIYKFLTHLSGRAVPNRFVAFQIVQEYGIWEYVIPPPYEEKVPFPAVKAAQR